MNVALGGVFALCAQDRIRAGGMFASPSFLLVLIFVVFGVLPATLYVYLVHSAWAWMFVVDPESVPRLILVPVLVLAGGSVVGGWCVGAELIRRGKEKIAKYAVGGMFGFTLVLVVFCLPRLALAGTYAEFWEGNALGLQQVKLGYVLLVLALGLGSAAGYIGVALARDSTRVRSRQGTANDILS